MVPFFAFFHCKRYLNLILLNIYIKCYFYNHWTEFHNVFTIDSYAKSKYFRLADPLAVTFNAALHQNQMTEVLLLLKDIYLNEAVCRPILVNELFLFNVDNEVLLTRFYLLYKMRIEESTLQLWECLKTGNFMRFFRILPRQHVIQRWLMFHHVAVMRLKAFTVISKAYGSKQKLAIETICSWLGHSNREDLKKCLFDFGAVLTEDHVTFPNPLAHNFHLDDSSRSYWYSSDFAEPIYFLWIYYILLFYL